MTGRFVYNSAIGALNKRLTGHDGITLGPVSFVAGPPSGDGTFEIHEARHQQQWYACVFVGLVLVAIHVVLEGSPRTALAAAWLLVIPCVLFWVEYYLELLARIVVLLGLQRPNPVQNAYLDLWAEVDARATAQQRRPLPTPRT